MQIGTLQFKPRESEISQLLLLRYYQNQIKQQLYPYAVVVGRQRTGKTAFAMWLAERIAEMRGSKFDARTDMFFSIEDMLARYRENKNKVYILDEAGVSLNVYEGGQIHQRVFQKIMETQAYLGNILILCLPHVRDIGKHHLNHLTVLIKMKRRGCYCWKYIYQTYDDIGKKVRYDVCLYSYPFFKVERI